MKVPRSLAFLLLSGLLVGGGAGVATAAPAVPVVPTLVGVRAAHHPGLDRTVFTFRGGLPATRKAAYVPRLLGDASGRQVRIAGRAVLRVTFSAAKAHDASGATAPARVAFPLPNVMTAVRAGDFESVTTYGLGLAKRTPFRVSTLRNPARVVVDVGAAFATVGRKVYFLSAPRFARGAEPYVVPRQRPVLPLTPATGVLDRLFAGPLPGERASGLRLVRSAATGFTQLSIAHGIARVRLAGGCNSRGSTATIAGEIMPTLRQFPSVDWVKIYAPDGTTERPNGAVDSIPACLEP